MKKFKINIQLFATKIPTSDDIYIRIIDNNVSKRVAAVQSVKPAKNKEIKTLEAFGEKEAIGTYGFKTTYELTLSRAYVTDEGIVDGIYLDELEDFDIVIEKPDCTEQYLMCNWNSIDEDMGLKEKVVENMKVTAAKFKRIKK